MNDNENKTTHRGMIVKDQQDEFLVSITGQDKLFSLKKSSKNCIHLFEPLSRFEFEGYFEEQTGVHINELVRFDNVLKIKLKQTIESLLAQLQENLDNKIADIKLLNDIQNYYKSEHIPFSVFGFDKFRVKFWQLDLCLKIDEVEQSEPGKNRELLIENLNKRTFMFENNPDQCTRYKTILKSFEDPHSGKEVYDKENRILVAESEVPKVGEYVDFPFLKQLGAVLIKTIGKSFILKENSSTVSKATKKRLSGQKVCWVYYETKAKKGDVVPTTAKVDKSEISKPRSINELIPHLNRIKKLFELDGIKPRNSNSYIGDFRTGVELCDMRYMHKTYWFVLSDVNIWYIDSEESTALLHHNIQIGGRSYLGYVLTRSDYQDVENSLLELNKTLVDLRKKIMDARV